jgi:hypothetical protein
LALDFNETKDFDGKLQVFQPNMHKISGINPKPFFFIYGFFLKNQNSQYVGIDVRPPIQRGWG